MTIKRQTPGSDQIHGIPEGAEITFELSDGTKIGFRAAKASDGAEHLLRIRYGKDPYTVDYIFSRSARDKN